MGQKRPAEQLELYRRADEVLHYLWDPIGIAGTPEARDEYYGYLSTVFKLLMEERDAGAIRDYLLEVEENRMGLTVSERSRKRADLVVERLFQWKEIALSKTNTN